MTSTTPGLRRNSWEQFPVAAENYERDLVPALFQPWAHDLLDLAGVRPGERVLDLACGTGIVARTAAPRVLDSGAVLGLDANADMLAVARRVAATIRPAIDWRQASAVDTGLADAGFDVAVCQQGMQFFTDRPAAARELYRVVTPGGRVAVSVWCDEDPPGYVPFITAFTRHLPETPAAAEFVRAIFSLGDTRELHDLLTEAGFDDVQISYRTATVRFPTAEAWARAFLGAAPIPGVTELDATVRCHIIAEVAEALHSRVDESGLSFPTAAATAVARRP